MRTKPKTVECKTHGVTPACSNGVRKGKKRYKCQKCRTEWLKKRRKEVKKELVEYKGGKCSRCGYAKSLNALEFHHENDDKEFSLGTVNKGYFSMLRLKREVDKCILLCANCHREEHDQLGR